MGALGPTLVHHAGMNSYSVSLHDFHVEIYYFTSLHMEIKISMTKHKFDYVDLQDLTCINFIPTSMLKTCDILFYSMVYLSCWFVRYSSDKACCSFSTHNLGDIYFAKIKCYDIMTPHVSKILTKAKVILAHQPNTNAIWSCFEFCQALRYR